MADGYWAVVRTEPQREHIARLLLMLGRPKDAMPNYETYMPRILLKAGKIVLLFPSYIFVRIIDRWSAIESTPGVIEVLKTGEQPHKLPETIVTAIRKREVGGLVKLPTKQRLRKGDKVQITHGSFQGQIGVYDGMSVQQRERVLLELLGRIVKVELSSSDIAPLAPQDIALEAS